MFRIFNSARLNHSCLYIVLSTFSMACVNIPCHAHQFNANTGINFNDAALMLKLHRIVDKLMKLEKKGTSNEMIDLVLEVKKEVENAIGRKINLNDKLNEVQRQAQQKGCKIPKKQFENFKRELVKREKKQVNRGNQTIFRSKQKENEKDKKDKEKEEVELPVSMAFGITVALCGVFLCCLPSPQAKEWGSKLITYGMGIAVSSGLAKQDEDQKERKKENKR